VLHKGHDRRKAAEAALRRLSSSVDAGRFVQGFTEGLG
jgi:hypothetical protein